MVSVNLGKGFYIEMVKIPAGKFLMGSPQNESLRNSNESPQHQVTLRSFYISKYLITQDQYRVVTAGKNPSYYKGRTHPVDSVSWYDADEFCQKLTEKTGKSYRLPSEAEWEYACRAGTTTPFYFGETITSELANYDASNTYASEVNGIYRQRTTEVGSFAPNVFGLYDNHGNVWEWCQDVWHQNYKGAPDDGSVWEVGGDSNQRVLRGGSWLGYPWDCRSAARDGRSADFCVYDCGFRVVCFSGMPGI